MKIHHECRTICRRGEPATPCRVIGGCEVIWAPVCVLCTTSLDDGHICHHCAQRIRRDLDDILNLVMAAAAQTIHTTTGTGNAHAVPGSRPPLVVEALDPELTTVRIIDSDPSTDLPLLEILEAWERVIREDRMLAPYGPASAQRLTRFPGTPTQNTLTGVITFLHAHHEWVCSEPSFDIAEYARQVRLCRKAVARWDMTSQPPGWRVPCPTVTDHGECGQIVKIQRGHDHAYCKRCERSWDVAHLIAVAGRDADVWVDVEAAATLAGVHERTIRKWVQRGSVRKRGQLVRVLDIKHNALGLTGS